MNNYWEIWLSFFEQLKPGKTIERYKNAVETTYEKTKETVSTRIVGALTLLLLFTLGLALIIIFVPLGFVLIFISYILWLTGWFLLLGLFSCFFWIIWIIGGEETMKEVAEWITDDTAFAYRKIKDYILSIFQFCSLE